MNWCVSAEAEAHHYDANNNPLSVYASTYGECKYSIDASPCNWTYVDTSCDGFGVASCNKCTIMFRLFQVEDDFEAEAASESCFLFGSLTYELRR